MSGLQHEGSRILQKAIEFHDSRVLRVVAQNPIHCRSRFVLGNHHYRAQKVLQASFVFGMVANESMNLAEVVANDHVESNAGHGRVHRRGCGCSCGRRRI